MFLSFIKLFLINCSHLLFFTQQCPHKQVLEFLYICTHCFILELKRHIEILWSLTSSLITSDHAPAHASDMQVRGPPRPTPSNLLTGFIIIQHIYDFIGQVYISTSQIKFTSFTLTQPTHTGCWYAQVLAHTCRHSPGLRSTTHGNSTMPKDVDVDKEFVEMVGGGDVREYRQDRFFK